MGIESASFLSQLDPANPAGSDPVSDADNHLRLIKQALKNTFPNLEGPVSGKAADFLGMVPRFGIVLWYGSPEELPSGWAICNGQTVTKTDGNGTVVTPDLRDKFAIGAGLTYTKGQAVGSSSTRVTTNTAGDHTHNGYTDAQGLHSHGGGTLGAAIGVEHIPPHNHGYGSVSLTSSGNALGLYFPSNVAVSAVQSVTENTGGGQPHAHGISSDGFHSHNVGTYGAGAHSHIADVPMLPSSVALFYIMKI